MGLPSRVLARIPDEQAIVALRMMEGQQVRDYHFRLKTKEGPNILAEYSLGAATPMSTTGTAWQEITDSQSRYHLEPEFPNILYEVFYGITPSYARVYRQYPAGVERGSLLGTRTVGGNVGYIDGEHSPLLYPSPDTEFWTLEGTHPSFNGYHPYAEPSSVTVRMTFYVVRFGVEFIRAPTPEEIMRRILRTMGGESLFQSPEWLRRA